MNAASPRNDRGQSLVSVKNVTSLDVARLAGVSQPTVSLVLGGRADSVRVSAETQQRVIDAAASLHYVPNRLAQSLRSRTTKVVCVVVPSLQNPFYADVVDAVQAAADARGYTVNVMVANTVDAEKRIFTFLAGGSVDAVLMGARPGPALDLLHRLSTRGVVCLVLQGEGVVHDLPSISVDLDAGGYAATTHLISLGHSRVAYISEHDAPHLSKYMGYLRALADAGIDHRPKWVAEGDNSMAGGADAMQKLLSQNKKDRPTALFAYNDLMAIGALRVLREIGLRVPDDIAVVGFDGTRLGAFINPALTTMAHERNAVAVEVLFDRLANPDHPIVSQTLPIKLVVRESCGMSKVANDR